MTSDPIAETIIELKQLYRALVKEAELPIVRNVCGDPQCTQHRNTISAEPVILISSSSRRKEPGWVTVDKTWKSVFSKINAELGGPQDKLERVFVPTIFFASEHLQDDPQDIIFTMMHQITHLVTPAQTTTYHSERFASKFYALWGVKLKRVPVLGYYERLPMSEAKFNQLVGRVSQGIRWTAFDYYQPESPDWREPGPTRMKLWICGCKPRPVRVRTARMLVATCERCHQVFKYADKDRNHPEVANKFYHQGMNNRLLP